MIVNNFKIKNIAAGALVALCLMITGLAVVGYIYRPRNTEAGQIIDQYGIFRSPYGNGLVIVNLVDSSKGKVTVSANSRNKTPSTTMTFLTAQTWFGTWDERDRFWTYIDGAGVHIHDHANGISCTTHIDEFKDGNGIPSEFLRRLREAQSAE